MPELDAKAEYILEADENCAGKRLDQALAGLLPGLGLRGRRRLVSLGLATVNGSPAPPAMRLRRGDLVALHLQKTLPDSASQACFLGSSEQFCAFYKPAGLHTVRLGGSTASALEDLIPQLLPADSPCCTLLQRLDYGTSGIVSAALSKSAADLFRKWEKLGQCRKYYLTILQGELRKPVTARMPLRTDNRKKTIVGSGVAPALRHTCFYPLQTFRAGRLTNPQTVTLCEINCGQRHQIRSHACAIGHPLAGDELYGGGAGHYRLEHFCLDFPGHTFIYNPPESILGFLADDCRAKLLAILSAAGISIREDTSGNAD